MSGLFTSRIDSETTYDELLVMTMKRRLSASMGLQLQARNVVAARGRSPQRAFGCLHCNSCPQIHLDITKAIDSLDY